MINLRGIVFIINDEFYECVENLARGRVRLEHLYSRIAIVRRVEHLIEDVEVADGYMMMRG